MQKYLKYILLGMITFFIIDANVNAESSAKCVYDLGSGLIKLECNVSDSTGIDCALSGQNKALAILQNSEIKLKTVNFQNTKENKWKCPDSIYYKFDTVSDLNMGVIYSQYSNIQAGLTGDVSNKANLITSESNDGDKISSVKKEVDYCDYGSILISIDHTNKQVKIENSNCTTNNAEFYYSQIAESGCPVSIYMYTDKYHNTPTCSYSLSRKDGYSSIEFNTNTVIDGAGNNTNADYDYVDGCADVPQTISLIKQIYNAIRFLIPIIIIGLSIVDFLKVLLNGEEKVYKQAWSKFVKRIIIGIVILILPVILSFIINLSGITDGYGIDKNNIFCIFS